MRKQQTLIVILVGALFFSASGNVIAAAFCPRYLTTPASGKHAVRQSEGARQESSCQHEMADMEMGDTPTGETSPTEPSLESIDEESPLTRTTESLGEFTSITLPVQGCPHCWMHSQPPSGSAIGVAGNPATQLVTQAPATDAVATIASAPTASISPFEHSPPGNSLPRHVLINVFRI